MSDLPKKDLFGQGPDTRKGRKLAFFVNHGALPTSFFSGSTVLGWIYFQVEELLK